ncbi:MAG: LPXTG cell wall anchor domain-containing protein, partial [Oscillospiraceae bacterium]
DEKIKITITVPKDFTSPAVYYVADDGKIEKLASTTKNDDISFITDHNSFYAVVDEKSDIPQTGDNSTIILYELIILFSFSGILTLIIMRKKV